jgi:outer membrane protein assembly factor BamB
MEGTLERREGRETMRSALLIAVLAPLSVCARAGENWPEFRGPTGDGHARATGLALKWSETENVKWKTAIHGRGWSSPVIWAGQVWLTTAGRDGKELFAVCVDRRTGKVTRDVKVFDVARPQSISRINSYASPTPAVEAGRVYVHFGTHGTACLDTRTGKVLWTRRDLNCDHHMGPGASPILFENLLIFTVDGCDVQYVVALEKATGKTAWKTNRSVDYSRVNRYHRKAFCTPIVVKWRGRPQLISPGSKAVMAYDPRTGRELWKVRYGGWSMTPRPLFGHGLVFLIMDYDFPELWAIRPDGEGDVTESHVAWKIPRGKQMPAAPSQLLIGDVLFMVSDKGTASCVEAKTGRVVWRQRLGGQYWASPIYADGRIYFFSYDSVTTVIEPARQYRQLAVNRLDGRMMASPAVAGKALFLRTEQHLYRIEE